MPQDLDNLSNASSIPEADLVGKIISPDILKEIPEEAASFYQLIPFGRKGNTLEVAMVTPDDLKANEALRFITLQSKLTPKIYQISLTTFQDVFKQYRSLKKEVASALAELEQDLSREKVEIIASDDADRSLFEAPITKIVSNILRHAQDGRASDIHIEPLENEVRIRFRVDGVLYTSIKLPKKTHSAIISRIKILSGLKIDETRVPQDGRFNQFLGNTRIDFRVSSLPTAHGEKMALRLLDPTLGLMGFEELGLVGRSLQILKGGIAKPFGMVLLTGPTGSGKTTTLYAILNTLNKEGVNIISLEDPVEYYIEGVNQSQIKPEINFTFASGLRSILRQDPDIIMVGEIRDEETAALAVHAALTGHIVLSTLHTNNAIGVIPRLVDMKVGSFLLPSAINLAIAQRLLRRICQRCKKEIVPEPKVASVMKEIIASIPESIKKSLDMPKELKVFRSEGCKYCAGKGFQGRIAIYEVLAMTPQLEKIIVEGITEAKILQEAERQEMVTMQQDGIVKVLQGQISFEELMDIAEV